MKPRIVFLVRDVHMGLGHVGLAKLLKKSGADVTDLSDGAVAMCVNKKGDKLKVLGARGIVLGYLKMPGGQRIMLDAIQYIPRTFGAQGFDYDKAVGIALTNRFKEKEQGPLAIARARKAAGL